MRKNDGNDSIVSNIVRLGKTAKLQKPYILLSIMYIAIGAASIVTSQSLGRIVSNLDEGLKSGWNLSALLGAITFLAAGKLAEALLGWVSGIYIAKISLKTFKSFMMKSTDSFINSEYSWISRQKIGDLLSRINQNTGSAAHAVCEMLPVLIRNVLISAFVITFLFISNWRLALIYIIPLPLLFTGLFWGGGFSGKYKLDADTAMGEAIAKAQDLVNNRSTIKAYGIESNAKGWMSEKTGSWANKMAKAMAMLVVGYTPMSISSIIPQVLICGFGIAMVQKGTLSPGDFAAFFALSLVSSAELNYLANVGSNMPHLISSGKRILPIWDAPRQRAGNEAAIDEGRETVLEFKNVNFSYPPQEENGSEAPLPVLNNFSLKVKQGEHIAIVGPSGCGKSTVLKLAAGLYEASSGEVNLYGHSPRSWQRGAFSKVLGYMSQDTFLFPFSVKENVLIAARKAKEEEFLKAAELSGLRAASESFADGYDSNVGEFGSKVSGGQRQMIAIARLLLQDPKILVLDEATSALDAENESTVNKALKDAAAGRTVLMVTHRLSGALGADRVIVMDKGQVAEDGSHSQLLSQNGIYARLWAQEDKEKEDGING